MNVYECIAEVSAELAQAGISKTRQNAQQGYKFRGIDDVYNALAPIIAKHKLVIIPRILARSLMERTTKNGAALFYVTVEAEFDFVSAIDASKVTARTFGEAMDSADKATNKAMSAAYKYAAFQTFCIPTEGENDADAVTPEPIAPAASQPTVQQRGISAVQSLAPSVPSEPPQDWDDRPSIQDSELPPPQPRTGDVINEKQAKRFFAIAMNAGWDKHDLKAWLLKRIGTDDDRLIPRSRYEALCTEVSRAL